MHITKGTDYVSARALQVVFIYHKKRRHNISWVVIIMELQHTNWSCYYSYQRAVLWVWIICLRHLYEKKSSSVKFWHSVETCLSVFPVRHNWISTVCNAFSLLHIFYLMDPCFPWTYVYFRHCHFHKCILYMHLDLGIRTVGEEKDVKFYYGPRIYQFHLPLG
jgi:hypothetical protein